MTVPSAPTTISCHEGATHPDPAPETTAITAMATKANVRKSRTAFIFWSATGLRAQADPASRRPRERLIGADCGRVRREGRSPGTAQPREDVVVKTGGRLADQLRYVRWLIVSPFGGPGQRSVTNPRGAPTLPRVRVLRRCLVNDGRTSWAVAGCPTADVSCDIEVTASAVTGGSPEPCGRRRPQQRAARRRTLSTWPAGLRSRVEVELPRREDLP